MSESTKSAAPAVEPKLEAALREAIDAGVFYGRSKRNSNPRMRNSVLYTRNGMEVVNLNVTLEALDRAMTLLREAKAEGRVMLFIGTQPAFADLVQEFVDEVNIPAVTRRWIGGLITNFPVVSARIAHLKKLRGDLSSGAMQKYVKKERTMAEHELHKLEANMGTFENLAKVPDLVIVLDPVEHRTAVLEAKKIGIPVIAFGNVDSNPDEASHLVPGSVQGRKSVSWFLGKVREALA